MTNTRITGTSAHLRAFLALLLGWASAGLALPLLSAEAEVQRVLSAASAAAANNEVEGNNEAPANLRTMRRSPTVRREALPGSVPAISRASIGAHLSENAVVDAALFDRAPYLLGERNAHALAGTGDEVFARGAWTPGVRSYDIVRRGRDLQDPDTGALLGVEALFVGTASIAPSHSGKSAEESGEEPAEQAILTITRSVQEIRRGDRLVPRSSAALETSYLPRSPPGMLDAAIVSVGDAESIAGQFDTLILNVGSADGVEVGQLLVLRQPDVDIVDDLGNTAGWQRVRRLLGGEDPRSTTFAGTNIGSVLIYRVFDATSLGLVLQSSAVIRLDTRVVAP